jgi:uncharacterized protein (TIGR02466 family)
MSKIIFFFYKRNFFKIAYFLVNLISIFNNDYKKKISFYKFFKKRKCNYAKNILITLYQPKVFILNSKFNNHKILKIIKSYGNINKKNKYSYDGHKNIYQSEHNLNKKKEFKILSEKIEKLINLKLKVFNQNKLLKLHKMWFVIAKNAGKIKKHSHFDSDYSGIMYLKVEKNSNKYFGLKIYNPYKKIEIYDFSKKAKMTKSTIQKKEFVFKPKIKNIIIFNSYLEHSVDNSYAKLLERVSLPFDLKF